MSIFSKSAKLIGWSPINKLVELYIDESIYPNLIGKRILANIVSVRFDDDVTLKLCEPISVNDREISFVNATSRHKGYDFYHLICGSISADLSEIENKGCESDLRFSMCIVRLKKNN